MTTPRPETLAKLTPVLTKRWLSPDAWKMDVYEQLDGYARALGIPGARRGLYFPLLKGWREWY